MALTRSRIPNRPKEVTTTDQLNQGLTFTDKVITVKAGEDILRTLTSLSERENKIVLLLSCVGSVRHVTLAHPDVTARYEAVEDGALTIVHFNGFVVPPDTDWELPTEDMLMTVVAFGYDHPLIGGRVVESMEAASDTIIVAALFPPTAPFLRPSVLTIPQDTTGQV